MVGMEWAWGSFGSFVKQPCVNSNLLFTYIFVYANIIYIDEVKIQQFTSIKGDVSYGISTATNLYN